MPIATLYSLSSSKTLAFCAKEWFQQASDEELIRLALINFGCGVPSDFIAYFYERKDKEIADFLQEALATDPEISVMGFECRVNAEAALEWIKANRPHLYSGITKF